MAATRPGEIASNLRAQNDTHRLCRAQTNRLEREAARVGYALPFKPEVDPGRAFWLGGKYRDEEGRDRYPEIDEDNVVYDASEANELLEDLYRAGRVPPEDAAVFPPEDEPTSRHWSRRLHVLERVADRVPATNRWTAHAPYWEAARTSRSSGGGSRRRRGHDLRIQ